MKYYHGSSQHDLKISGSRNSRYGFPALFLASNIDLAVQYAFYNAEQQKSNLPGCVYEFDLPAIPKVIDFKNEITHNTSFRNLIYRLKSQKYSAVRILNALDYPSIKFKEKHYSTIVVVFDFEVIKNYHRIGTVSL